MDLKKLMELNKGPLKLDLVKVNIFASLSSLVNNKITLLYLQYMFYLLQVIT